MDFTDLLGSMFDSSGGGGDATIAFPNIPDNPGGDFSAPTYGMIDNGDGTFTDPSSGIIYDQNGTSTGQTDPNYGDPNNTLGGGMGTDPTGGGTGGTGGLGGSDILKALGGIPGLAGILAPLLGGLYAAHQTGKATQQVLGGIQNANTDIKSILGGQQMFAPYMQAGQSALGKLGGMNWTPLNYGPLGGSPGGAPMTLGSLASRRTR